MKRYILSILLAGVFLHGFANPQPPSPNEKKEPGYNRYYENNDGMPKALRETYYWCSKYVAVYGTYLSAKWILTDLVHHFKKKPQLQTQTNEQK
ncbi:hypothetical protein [Candidatus Azobacteroides pseudotrichonymphae]|jgi:hypothetical protein|uniref:hypothetical protein n=1 Tax=Candidatus Azobacteroides pseudotrichonymphae TaxID=511435 RepID=UPI00223C6CBE|nr:hypothetical protein [Candidatus Azobacteroides pseudotrichonymphae]